MPCEAMEVNLSSGTHPGSRMKSFNGCWTCRLRHKKCDEKHPLYDACAALHITCHPFTSHKPEWMDGGVRQEEMAERVKLEVKENAHRRRGERAVHTSDDHFSATKANNSQSQILPPILSSDLNTPTYDFLRVAPNTYNDGTEQCPKVSTILP